MPATILASGCGGEDASVFTPPTPDAAPPPDTTEAGSFFPEASTITDASAADSTAVCTPQALPNFSPTWKPPIVNTSACTGPQITGYATACLSKTSTATSCTTFLQLNDNKTCGACLDSDQPAANYGPFIWHANRSYFTLNVAGCLASKANDVTPMGCGAAYQASISCKQASCAACEVNGNFQTFQMCEQKAGGAVCKSYGEAIASKCASIADAGPDAGTTACFQATTETSPDFFLRFAKLFCGPT